MASVPTGQLWPRGSPGGTPALCHHPRGPSNPGPAHSSHQAASTAASLLRAAVPAARIRLVEGRKLRCRATVSQSSWATATPGALPPGVCGPGAAPRRRCLAPTEKPLRRTSRLLQDAAVTVAEDIRSGSACLKWPGSVRPAPPPSSKAVLGDGEKVLCPQVPGSRPLLGPGPVPPAHL